jgi:transcriptional regulator with XRE-family HTH domain
MSPLPAAHAAALLAERLGQARRQRGKTQQDLAAEAGIPQSQISKLERGQTAEPSYSTVVALARALQLSLDALSSSADTDWRTALDATHESTLSADAVAQAQERELCSAWLASRTATMRGLRQFLTTGDRSQLERAVSAELAEHLAQELAMLATRGLAPSMDDTTPPPVELVSLGETTPYQAVFREGESTSLSRLVLAADVPLEGVLLVPERGHNYLITELRPVDIG